eukprot:5424571-Alexandrium_andersonii.AAC.1
MWTPSVASALAGSPMRTLRRLAHCDRPLEVVASLGGPSIIRRSGPTPVWLLRVYPFYRSVVAVAVAAVAAVAA